MLQIFLKVASNVNEQGMAKRVLSSEDIADEGRFPSRVRSTSARSTTTMEPQIASRDLELQGNGTLTHHVVVK